MLQTLEVRDFILIERLVLELEPGFNVITGETGAGKSIIIGALELVLGGRARADMVRPGAKRAEVEALFDLGDHLEREAGEALLARLAEADIPFEGELVIRRVINDGGRSRAYLNGRLCTVAQLQAVAVELADVTSQHESVALADPGRHVDYLDRYGRLLDARHGVAEIVDALAEVNARIAELVEHEKSRAEREGYLRYQLEAIGKVDPQPDERDTLEAELSRLKHTERLSELTQHVALALDGATETAEGIVDIVGRLVGELTRAAELDTSLEPLAGELDELWTRLRDVARDTLRYAERLEADPSRLETIQARTFQLDRLLRQHGPTIDDVLGAQARLEAELQAFDDAETERPTLETRRQELTAEGSQLAGALSARRKREAKRLSRAISQRLGELGMGAARVMVTVAPSELGRKGIDRVQFLIAPNKGSEPRPLGRIASGGELSRALLALKQALGASEGPRGGIQVFDEVDTGVGGETADKIGRAIAAIAQQRQVLCITHLAAIAAYADAHFVVRKSDGEELTTSAIDRVDRRRRAEELARMLTGARATKNSIAAARDLLRSCAA